MWKLNLSWAFSTLLSWFPFCLRTSKHSSLGVFDKRIFSMYIFHYSCLIFKYFGYKIRMLNLFLNYWPRGKLMYFQILGYWTGRARQWNWTVIHYVLQKKLYNLVPDVCHHFQIAEMKVYKTYEGHITQFCCFEAQKASWKTRIEPARNSCTAHTVSVYALYLNVQRSKNCKISVIGKKIWFSTMSPEIEIFEFSLFLPQIWPAMSE